MIPTISHTQLSFMYTNDLQESISEQTMNQKL